MLKLPQSEIDGAFNDYHENENPFSHPIQDRIGFDAGYNRGYQAALASRAPYLGEES